MAAYFGLSVLWSSTQVDSLRNWMTFVLQVTVGLVICTGATSERILARMRWLALGFVAINILFAAAFPGSAFTTAGVGYEGAYRNAFRGIISSKNTLGSIMPVLLTFLAVDLMGAGSLARKAVSALGLAAGFGLMILSQSATGELASIFIVLIFGLHWTLGRIRSSGARLAFLLLALLASMVLALNFFSVMALVTSSLGRSSTFTGRGDLWNVVISEGSRNFWFGSGFEGFWQNYLGAKLQDLGLWQVNTAHNGFLEAFLDGGIIGAALVVFLFLWILFVALARLTRASNSLYAITALVILLQSFICNMSETAFPVPTTISGTALVIALVLLSNDTQRRKVKSAPPFRFAPPGTGRPAGPAGNV